MGGQPGGQREARQADDGQRAEGQVRVADHGLDDQRQDDAAEVPGHEAEHEVPSALASKDPVDPRAVVYQLEAWMPQTIAVRKLRGFIDDAGGEIVSNGPGQIHVRLGGPGSIYEFPRRKPSWFRLGRGTDKIDLELKMRQVDPDRQNLLHITVSIRSADGDPMVGANWRASNDRVFCDLRGYLMGHSGAPAHHAGQTN